MSAPEKPLHVRVAEALGETVHEVAGVWYTEEEMDAAEARHDTDSARPIPHYDTDWSATGPLIERHAIRLRPVAPAGVLDCWVARSFGVRAYGKGKMPLEAVCNLILTLSDLGLTL